MNSDGIWRWAKQAGGQGYDAGFDIAFDSSANIYLTGEFRSAATFGTTTLTSRGYRDLYVSKLESNGNWLWVDQAGVIGADRGSGIVVDSDTNIWVSYFLV